MKKIALFLALIICSFGALAQTATWTADPYHSKLAFTVTHLGIADVPGSFDKYEVNVKASKADFSDAVVDLTIQTSSINTGIEPRDNHLRSNDFFGVEKFPTMTFKSNSISKIADGQYSLAGDLTLLGVTKPITVKMNYRGTTKNPNAEGAPVAGLQFISEIKRSDFGLGANFPAPMLSDAVQIKADGEFGIKQ